MNQIASTLVGIDTMAPQEGRATADFVQQQVAAAYKLFESFQFRDAIDGFSRVLEADPNNTDASAGLNLAIQKTVPRWHFGMLNDHQRNDAFEAAIVRNVKDKVVLDVGSGSGLLAMMAARAGAKMVYTCEMDQAVAKCAEQIVAANGYANKIKVIGKKSDALNIGSDMAERADVLITETLDSALLGEGIVPIISDARERLLVDTPVVIPARADMYVALLDSRDLWNMNQADLASGFDVSLFNQFSSDGFYPVRLNLSKHQLLTAPVDMCSFDFSTDDLNPRTIDIPLEIKTSGKCYAVAYWLDLHLDDHTVFSTTPDNFDSHWKQAIQCFREPFTMNQGEKYVLSVQQSLTRFDFSLTPIGPQ